MGTEQISERNNAPQTGNQQPDYDALTSSQDRCHAENSVSDHAMDGPWGYGNYYGKRPPFGLDHRHGHHHNPRSHSDMGGPEMTRGPRPPFGMTPRAHHVPPVDEESEFYSHPPPPFMGRPFPPFLRMISDTSESSEEENNPRGETETLSLTREDKKDFKRIMKKIKKIQKKKFKQFALGHGGHKCLGKHFKKRKCDSHHHKQKGRHFDKQKCAEKYKKYHATTEEEEYRGHYHAKFGHRGRHHGCHGGRGRHHNGGPPRFAFHGNHHHFPQGPTPPHMVWFLNGDVPEWVDSEQAEDIECDGHVTPVEDEAQVEEVLATKMKDAALSD